MANSDGEERTERSTALGPFDAIPVATHPPPPPIHSAARRSPPARASQITADPGMKCQRLLQLSCILT